MTRALETVVVLDATFPCALLVVGNIVRPAIHVDVVQMIGHVHRLHVLKRRAELAREVVESGAAAATLAALIEKS